jgi:hypothetical protein
MHTMHLIIERTITGLNKKKLPVVKFIFTLFSVVELSSTGATFASLKHPVIGASLAFLPSIHCSVRGFQIFPNGGKIWFFGLRGNHASPTRKCPGNVFISL